jgi:hypothetical protein
LSGRPMLLLPHLASLEQSQECVTLSMTSGGTLTLDRHEVTISTPLSSTIELLCEPKRDAKGCS